MQFKSEQRAYIETSWGKGSWFFDNLGFPARAIVERAYGLRTCSPTEMSKSQEALTLVTSVFARRIGAEKSQVVHALLTGELNKLLAAIGRKKGAQFSTGQLAEEWQQAFRDVGTGSL